MWSKYQLELERRICLSRIQLKEGASTLARSSDWRGKLQAWMINSDRHQQYYPYLNIAWLCPELESAVQILRTHSEIAITQSDFSKSKQLCEKMSETFGNVDSQVRAFVEFINQFLVDSTITVSPKSVDERNQNRNFEGSVHAIYSNNGPDAYLEHRRALVVILEAKKQQGQCENPQVQISFDYAKVAKRMNDLNDGFGGYFPCLLLCMDGNQFSVGLGSMYHEITTQFYIERVSMEKSKAAIVNCAQALVAVRNCVSLLTTEEFSSCYPSRTSLNAAGHSSCFPQMSYFDLFSQEKISLQGIAKISISKSIYIAIASSSSLLMQGHIFCVKYTSSYCEELHQFLARNQMAPTLRSCREIVNKDKCVVMDWIMNCLTEEDVQQLPITTKMQIASKLRSILCVLKEANFVHGDLRSPNIMVSQNNNGDPQVHIIDFDFGGYFNQARYPHDLDVTQFPWLLKNEERQSGDLINFKDDADAIEHYISSVLQLHNVNFTAQVNALLFANEVVVVDGDETTATVDGANEIVEGITAAMQNANIN